MIRLPKLVSVGVLIVMLGEFCCRALCGSFK